MKQLKMVYTLFRDAAKDFSADDAITLAASIGFYTLFSLAPLLLIIMALGGMAGADAQQRLVDQAELMAGENVAESLASIMENAKQEQGQGRISMIIGFATLAFAATAVFAQFQTALNRIWNVEQKPSQGFIKSFLRKRATSLGMILMIGLLLIGSVVLNSVLPMLPWGNSLVIQILTFLLSLGLFVLVFALLFKYVPDVRIAWHDVWIGASITALLFALGNLGLGKYVSGSAAASSYGAAGSLVILLLWVYYSATIVFFGAEITQVYARRYGAAILPEKNSRRADKCASDQERSEADDNKPTIEHETPPEERK